MISRRCRDELRAEAAFPERSAFIFGHEEMGISFDRADYPDIQSLSIPQYGRVQSLNVRAPLKIHYRRAGGVKNELKMLIYSM